MAKMFWQPSVIKHQKEKRNEKKCGGITSMEKKGESQDAGIGGVNMVSLKVQKEVGWG